MPKYESKTVQRRERYRIGRLQLIYKLGGVCVDCGEDDPDVLQFDHLEARTWAAAKTSHWVRLANYKREADAGLVELRCKPCNCKKGKPAGGVDVNEEPIPE